MDNYRRGSHSKYSLKVHIIFVTKYRRKCLNYNSGLGRYCDASYTITMWKNADGTRGIELMYYDGESSGQRLFDDRDCTKTPYTQTCEWVITILRRHCFRHLEEFGL